MNTPPTTHISRYWFLHFVRTRPFRMEERNEKLPGLIFTLSLKHYFKHRLNIDKNSTRLGYHHRIAISSATIKLNPIDSAMQRHLRITSDDRVSRMSAYFNHSKLFVKSTEYTYDPSLECAKCLKISPQCCSTSLGATTTSAPRLLATTHCGCKDVCGCVCVSVCKFAYLCGDG